MRASPTTTMCLWPGLPRLWVCGDWSALATAVAFGAGLNLVLIATMLQPGLLPGWADVTAWIVLVAVWLLAAVRSYGALGTLEGRQDGAQRGLFLQAQAEYLRGHWYEAESLLQRLVSDSHDDVAAQFMLASLYRHTRRVDAAQKQLQRIERLDHAAQWHWELRQERELLRRLSETGSNTKQAG